MSGYASRRGPLANGTDDHMGASVTHNASGRDGTADEMALGPWPSQVCRPASDLPLRKLPSLDLADPAEDLRWSLGLAAAVCAQSRCGGDHGRQNDSG